MGLLKSLISIISIILSKESSSSSMAVPKSRRSKSKGRTRLSNWKKKAATASKKPFNLAKKIVEKEKQPEVSIEKDV